MTSTSACPTVDAGIRRRDRITRRMQMKPSVRTIAALILAHAARTDLTVTSNDVRDEAYALCPDIEPNDFGAAFTGLRTAGVAEVIGFGGRSTSERAQGNAVRRWRIDPVAATVYLDKLAAQAA